ncbi:hypothetical protein DMENIID0001_016500 [Sergentomyia squamirostris]
MMPLLVAMALESPMVMKGELVFSKWPSKAQMIPLKAMMIKVRGPAKLPSQIILTKINSRPSRPVQKIILPAYSHMKPSAYGLRPPFPTYTYLKPVMFTSSPPGPHSGEYVYENPFYHQQTVSTFNQPSSGPIHTIPAPNLAPVGPLAPIPHIQDNHIYDTTSPPTMNPYYTPSRPLSVKPYKVTEDQTNDLTLHDPQSGRQTYYAPDPDPRLPVVKVPIENNHFGQPSNGRPLPSDVVSYSHYSRHPEPTTTAPSAATKHIMQYVKLGTRPIFPHMQKQIAQQMTMLHGMPDSVYNPTYLVTQSNNLLQQHQQHLFRPEPSYIAAYQQQHQHQQNPHQTYITHNTVPESYQNAASPGQIYQAHHDQLQHDHHDDTSAYKELLEQATEYFHSGAYMNYPNTASTARPTYAEESAPTPSFYYSPDLMVKHQEENARILEEANAELMNKSYSMFHDEPETSHSHQRSIIAEPASKSEKTMRIYVPDEEYTTDSDQVGNFVDILPSLGLLWKN